VKEDTEHDLEMEKLFSERMRAAQLEIDRLAAEAAITPGAGSPAFRRKAGCALTTNAGKSRKERSAKLTVGEEKCFTLTNAAKMPNNLIQLR
jgi:hypothetical protein